MPAKQSVVTNEEMAKNREPRRRRDPISDEARKWREDNSEAARAWAEWIEKNGLPLRPLF